MPELPEVQTTVDGVNITSKNLIITDVWTNYASPLKMHEGTIKNPSYFSLFKKTIRGARILHATRRAKNVLIHLSLPQGKTSEQTILVHMKMTGHLLYGKYKNNKGVWSAVDNIALADPFNRHVRLVFCLSNGNHLVLSDMRKFAKVTLIPTRNLASSPHLSTSGPEPLEKDFTEKVFEERLTLGKNKPVKTVLMDHTVVAGVGNIYSDEILWLVDTHPLTKTNTLSEKTLQKMYVFSAFEILDEPSRALRPRGANPPPQRAHSILRRNFDLRALNTYQKIPRLNILTTYFIHDNSTLPT